MKKVILLALSLTLLGAACNRQQQTPDPLPYSDGTIHLAGRSISYELADEISEQQRGLSGRAAIEENQGMLFTFTVPSFLGFWMKDMNFPIDIVWIRGDEVVDISADAPAEPGVPDDQLKSYTPKVPADRVLELKAGWAARNGLKIGDKIEVLQVVK